jgi:sensor histidine kinase YesM
MHSDTGIGLNNTLERLTKLYKGKFKFLVQQHSNGVNVQILLPVAAAATNDAKK